MAVKSKEDLFPIVSSPMLEYQQQSVDREIKLFASSINQVEYQRLFEETFSFKL